MWRFKRTCHIIFHCQWPSTNWRACSCTIYTSSFRASLRGVLDSAFASVQLQFFVLFVLAVLPSCRRQVWIIAIKILAPYIIFVFFVYDLHVRDWCYESGGNRFNIIWMVLNGRVTSASTCSSNKSIVFFHVYSVYIDAAALSSKKVKSLNNRGLVSDEFNL